MDKKSLQTSSLPTVTKPWKIIHYVVQSYCTPFSHMNHGSYHEFNYCTPKILNNYS